MDKSRHLTKDEQTIAFFAFRYALGRMTYAPGLVNDYILAHLDSFDEASRRSMIEEIDDHERQWGLGMECDQKTWAGFKDRLKQSLSTEGAI